MQMKCEAPRLLCQPRLVAISEAPSQASNGFEQRLEHDLTTDADLGLDAALPRVIELTSKIGEFGRGERI